MNEKFTEQPTVNGIPVKDLSEVGQAIFKKIMVLKQEADEFKAQFEAKQAALKELSEMIVAEVEQIKAKETSVAE